MDDSSFFSKGALSGLNLTGTEMASSINQQEYLNQIRAETFWILHLRTKIFSHWKKLIITQKEALSKEYKLTRFIFQQIKQKYFLKWKNRNQDFNKLNDIGIFIKLLKYYKMWKNQFQVREDEQKKQMNFYLNVRKHDMNDYFQRWKYVKWLAKESKRYTRDAEKIFLGRCFRAIHNLILHKKNIIKNFNLIKDNHEYFLTVNAFDEWKKAQHYQRLARFVQRKNGARLKENYFYTWKEKQIRNVRFGKQLKKYSEKRNLSIYEYYFDLWLTKVNKKQNLVKALKELKISRNKWRIFRFFHMFIDKYEMKIKEDKETRRASEILEDYKLSRAFSKWSHAALNIIKENRDVYNAKEMLLDSLYSRAFFKWKGKYTALKFIKKKNIEVRHITQFSQMRRSFVRWKCKYESRKNNRDNLSKAISFRNNLLMIKAFTHLKTSMLKTKKIKSIIKGSVMLRKIYLMNFVFRPWLQFHKKLKFRVFLVSSVLNNYNKEITNKHLTNWIKYHNYKKKKANDQEEAFQIFENRKHESLFRAFIAGSKQIDLLESDSSFQPEFQHDIDFNIDNLTLPYPKSLLSPLKLSPFKPSIETIKEDNNKNYEKQNIIYQEIKLIPQSNTIQKEVNPDDLFIEITSTTKPKLNPLVKFDDYKLPPNGFVAPKRPSFLPPANEPKTLIKEEIKENNNIQEIIEEIRSPVKQQENLINNEQQEDFKIHEKEKLKLSPQEVQNELHQLASLLQINQTLPRTDETKAEAQAIYQRLQELSRMIQ